MMEYEMFKGVVAEKFKEFLPEEMQSAKVEIREVQKVNKTKDGLTLVNVEAGMSISPTIYIDDMYGLSTLFQTNFLRLFSRYCTGV